MPDAVVRLEDAAFGHGHRSVLEHVQAQARPGERVLLVGDNGSGKSTLLETLAGLLPKRHGAVQVLGLDPLQARRVLHGRIGFLGHDEPLYPELSAAENLHLHGALREIGAADAVALLERVGLAGQDAQAVATYSHGMRRRLGVAKALLGDPHLLLLDEPENGLDAAGRTVLRGALEARPAGPGTRAVILATHGWADWLDGFDTAWVLAAGRLAVVPLQGPSADRQTAVHRALAPSADPDPGSRRPR